VFIGDLSPLLLFIIDTRSLMSVSLFELKDMKKGKETPLSLNSSKESLDSDTTYVTAKTRLTPSSANISKTRLSSVVNTPSSASIVNTPRCASIATIPTSVKTHLTYDSNRLNELLAFSDEIKKNKRNTDFFDINKNPNLYDLNSVGINNRYPGLKYVDSSNKYVINNTEPIPKEDNKLTRVLKRVTYRIKNIFSQPNNNNNITYQQ
jgi:hypothetical protein